MYAGEQEARLQKLVSELGWSRERVLKALAVGDIQVADEGPAFGAGAATTGGSEDDMTTDEIVAAIGEARGARKAAEAAKRKQKTGTRNGTRKGDYTVREADQILEQAQERLARGKPIKKRLMGKILEIGRQYPELGKVLGGPARGDDRGAPAPVVRRDSVTGRFYVVERRNP